MRSLMTDAVLLPCAYAIVEDTTCLNRLQVETHGFRFVKDSLEAVDQVFMVFITFKNVEGA